MHRTRLKPLSALLAVGLLPACRLACAGPEPPRFTVAASGPGPVTFIAYGDTRFSDQEGVANPLARRALVEGIARENPAAILIGGDLVYDGSTPDDYETFRRETAAWSEKKTPVFPVLGNHELQHCSRDEPATCLGNWWQALSRLPLRPFRWYSVAIGPTLLALMLDSTSPLRRGSEQRLWFEREVASADPNVRLILIVMHYPPVRDPIYPGMGDEREIERYLTAKAPSLSARVLVVGSHVHNYERYERGDVTYLVSGGGGANPVPAVRMFGELSRLRTGVNFHYIRFTLEGARLTGTMVRFDPEDRSGHPWSEPDRFEIRARD